MNYNIVEINVKGKLVKRAEIICANCCNSFYVKPSHGDKLKNCSKECGLEYKRKVSYQKMCSLVEGDFREWLIQKYETEMMSTRDISEILYKTKTNSPNVLAWMKKLTIPPRGISESIANQFNKPGRRELSSRVAKMNFNTKQAREKALKTQMTPENRRKASIAKKGKNNPMYGIRGADSPHWKPEYDSNLNVVLRKDFESRRWRNAVFERDSYACQICRDDTGGNLNAHHLNGWDNYIEQRYDVGNGTTLCENCHKAFHKEYGYGNNTVSQFEEFLKLRV